jgi:hypothetical protein
MPAITPSMAPTEHEFVRHAVAVPAQDLGIHAHRDDVVEIRGHADQRIHRAEQGADFFALRFAHDHLLARGQRDQFRGIGLEAISGGRSFISIASIAMIVLLFRGQAARVFRAFGACSFRRRIQAGPFAPAPVQPFRPAGAAILFPAAPRFPVESAPAASFRMRPSPRKPMSRPTSLRPPQVESAARVVIAGAQFAVVPNDIPTNLYRCVYFLRRAVEDTGAKLLVFPESITTGFNPALPARDLYELLPSTDRCWRPSRRSARN